MSATPPPSPVGRPNLTLIDGGLGRTDTPAGRRRHLAAELDAVAGLAFGPEADSPAMAAALDAVAGLPPCDLVLVPRAPDAAMLDGGAAAGPVDAETAARIWSAMVEVAE